MERTALLERVSWRVGTVTALRYETPTARTIVLDIPGWPGHLAGQHVDVRLTAPDGYSAVRSYSIASAANSNTQVEITVERFAQGEVSPYLTQELATGDMIEIRGPIGGWFVWRPEQLERVQLIAGGSGIVPLMSMMRTRAASGNTSQFRLLYSVRAPDATYYRAELQTTASGTNGIATDYVYTRRVPEGWPEPPHRINAESITRAAWPSTVKPSCYVCGPTPFVETVARLLTHAGYDPATIRTERFGPTGERQ